MRKILLSFFALMTVQLAMAQQPCTPIASYIDSPSAVHPWPYDSLLFPSGGIKKVACIDKPYNFTFTIRIKDTITVNFLGAPTPIPIDSIKLTPNNGVTGLPVGLTYACYPTSCVFKKNTLGCVLIQGTPTAANQPRIYPLSIVGKAHLFLFPQGYDLSIPGAAFPGKYDLKLVTTNSAECVSSTRDLSAQIGDIQNIPNPFSDVTNIQINAIVGGTYQFLVQNSLGQAIHQQTVLLDAGENIIPFNAHSLQNGIYFYSLVKGNRLITRKMVVNH